jgi:hypothetical protein
LRANSFALATILNQRFGWLFIVLCMDETREWTILIATCHATGLLSSTGLVSSPLPFSEKRKKKKKNCSWVVHLQIRGSMATSQQPQTSHEGLELSVELEQARQQIITLQQVLLRCYLRNFLNMLSLF